MSNSVFLGTVPPTALGEVRLQLHYAAQIPAAVGHALIAPRPDDSQSNLGWDNALGALIGHETPQGYRAGLRCHDLSMLVLSGDRELLAEHSLDGGTLEHGIAWMSAELTRLAGGNLPAAIRLRDYEMPPHAVGTGTPFSCSNSAAYREIGRWFAHADHVLGEVRTHHAGTSPPRVWPHHFDMGLLISLDPGADPEAARAVGLGFSPGDALIAEPYWYAYAYPTPATADPPRLAGGGTWSTEGFAGALLRGSDLVTQPTAEAQLAQAREFINSAAKVCHELLGVVTGR